ncbi:MAG: hypothetical protein AB8C84_04435 [Oligoflexales bacterium]
MRFIFIFTVLISGCEFSTYWQDIAEKKHQACAEWGPHYYFDWEEHLPRNIPHGQCRVKDLQWQCQNTSFQDTTALNELETIFNTASCTDSVHALNKVEEMTIQEKWESLFPINSAKKLKTLKISSAPIDLNLRALINLESLEEIQVFDSEITPFSKSCREIFYSFWLTPSYKKLVVSDNFQDTSDTAFTAKYHQYIDLFPFDATDAPIGLLQFCVDVRNADTGNN